jgi:hypothetical protein
MQEWPARKPLWAKAFWVMWKPLNIWWKNINKIKISDRVLYRNIQDLFYLENFMKNGDFGVVVESGGR